MATLNIENMKNFFTGKKILVTGHTGFKGGWLSKILIELGAEVTGLSLPPREDSFFKSMNLKDQIHHFEDDIRDFRAVQSVFDQSEPEIVFHLAAQALVQRSYHEPLETLSTNIIGSSNILEATKRSAGVRACVYITSDKCYLNREWVWGYRETDQLGGHDPYSASKAAAELVFESYLKSFFAERENFACASARAGNVIGGGDWSDNRLVPDCVRSINKGITIELKKPDATRPWQHVLEPLSGYLLLGQKLFEDGKKFNGSWNFGPQAANVKTVGELVNALLLEYGMDHRVELKSEKDKFYESNLLQLNCDKANILLGWTPRWDFQTCIKHTVDWYKAPDAEHRNIVTENQINSYFSEAG